jgi:hypothetical protein
MYLKNILIGMMILISSFLRGQTYSDDYVRELEMKVHQQQLTIDSMDYYLQMGKLVMLKQNEKRKIWMKIAASELLIAGGVVLAISTGLWVPVFMGVFVLEMGIVTEGNYRLNLRQLKKQRALYGREKPDGKLGHK